MGCKTFYEDGPDSFVTLQSLPQQLSLLQELDLGWVYVHPAWLERLTTLRKLSLADVTMDYETDDEDDRDEFDEAGMLLRALGRLTQLEVCVVRAASCWAGADLSTRPVWCVLIWVCLVSGLLGACSVVLCCVRSQLWLCLLCRVDMDGLPDPLNLVPLRVSDVSCASCCAATTAPAGFGPGWHTAG